MRNFELIFDVTFDDGEGIKPHYCRFTRVIVVEDEAMARRVAEAMLGEEVNACEYLTSINRVAPTENWPDINSWSSDHSWKCTLAKMGISESSIEFVLNKFGHKVGIKLKSSR